MKNSKILLVLKNEKKNEKTYFYYHWCINY